MLPQPAEDKTSPRPNGKWHSTVRRYMTILVLGLATVIVVGVSYLSAICPGRPASLYNASGDVTPGSRLERVTVEIADYLRERFGQLSMMAW